MVYEIYKNIIHFLMITLVIEQIIIIMGRRKRSVYHMLLCGIVIMTVGGFAVLMDAKNLEVALEANRVTYLGGCLLPLVVLKIGASLCNLKIKMSLYIALAVMGFVVMGMAWSAGYLDFYYKEVSIEIIDGLTVLHKVYGPWHFWYNVYLGGYMIFALGVLVRGIRNRKNFSNRLVIVFAAIWALVDLTYFAERLLKTNARIMPISMAVAMTVFVFWFRKVSLFDMNSNLINVDDMERENGYLVFDTRGRLMTSNAMAAKFFPEVSKIAVDNNADNVKGTEFFEKVYAPFFFDGLTLLDNVSKDDKTLRIVLRPINAVGQLGARGWVVEIKDVSEEARYNEMLRGYRERLEIDAVSKTKSLDEIRQTIVMGIASMIESRDFSTGGHIRRTSDVVRIFADELLVENFPLSRKFLHEVVIAAPMHDLGKISVDDAVLRKKDKYTPEEYDIMKTHAAKGAVIVRRVLSGIDDEELVNVVANVAHYHHEKWNGQGYPAGLKGEEIPIEARIMALADVFDALVSKRYYKEAYSYDEAFRIIEESIGSHFDPELGEVFLNARPRLEELYNKYARENIEGLESEVGL